MEPVPVVSSQRFGAVAAHVHVAAVRVAGNTSLTVTPATFEGPRFVTTIVYVVDVPACTWSTQSVFVTEMSACRVIVAGGVVALLLLGSGSVTPLLGVTVAVFVTVPVAAGSTVPVTR